MPEKAMLVPQAGDGPAAREILAELQRLMAKRVGPTYPLGRPLGAKLARDFAERLRQARYIDQQRERRTA